MRIVALDPGGTTGVATYTFETTHEGEEGTWERNQLGPEEHHDSLEAFLDVYEPHTIVYERFNYQRRELDKGVSLRLDSVEYIGVIKLWHAKRFETVTLVPHQPSQMNLFGGGTGHDDGGEKLKKLGLYIPGAPHAMDATRHLMYYLVVTLGQRWWLERLKPAS
jgi:hypothetical protein